jgi:hypothetical protein
MCLDGTSVNWYILVASDIKVMFLDGTSVIWLSLITVDIKVMS